MRTYFVVLSDLGVTVARTQTAGWRVFQKQRHQTSGDIVLNQYDCTVEHLDAFLLDGVEAFREIEPSRELFWRRS